MSAIAIIVTPKQRAVGREISLNVVRVCDDFDVLGKKRGAEFVKEVPEEEREDEEENGGDFDEGPESHHEREKNEKEKEKEKRRKEKTKINDVILHGLNYDLKNERKLQTQNDFLSHPQSQKMEKEMCIF